MVLNIENLKGLTRKLLRIIVNEFSETAGYKSLHKNLSSSEL